MTLEEGLTHTIATESDSEGSKESLEARWQRVWRAERAFATPAAEDERAPAYVFADCFVAGEEEELGHIRAHTIADAYARFLRARGRAVLFSMGIESFGPAAERAALGLSISPNEWVERCGERLRDRLEAVGCSCDWERTVISCEPNYYGWTQRLFLAMLEHDLLYKRDTQWFLRIDGHIEENERGLTALGGWEEAAIDLQRATIGRVEGVEIDASTFDGSQLTVFTPHAEAIATATFVAISPAHVEVDKWTADPAVAEQVAFMRGVKWGHLGEDAEKIPMVTTDGLATVPGVPGMLPIVISPLVDMRFGPTAVLGMPELDSTDREIAKRLPAPAGAVWKTSSSGPSARPAVRYRARDLAITHSRPWGAPVPLIDCPACGIVPVPVEELPVLPPDDLRVVAEGEDPLERVDLEHACPRCDGAARREAGTIDRLERMSMWMAICAPPERRSASMTNDSEYARWLPAEQVVSDVDSAADLFERRLLADMLQDVGELPPLPDREPFSKALMHQCVRVRETTVSEQHGDAVNLDELIVRVGGDAVRLTMLHAASPGRPFSWSEQPLLRCQRFLQTLYDYAEPRLRAWAQMSEQTPERASIDTSGKMRRRLAHWCAVASDKVTLQLENLQMQRAAHNVMLLSTRIQDFESRVLEHGEIGTLDREAIVAALLVLVRLLAPLTPHIAEELWSAAGNTTLVCEADWPSLTRPARAE